MPKTKKKYQAKSRKLDIFSRLCRTISLRQNHRTRQTYSMRAICLFAAFFIALSATTPIHAEPAHGLSMHGTLKHAPGFKHFSYVNPDAPKGGRLILGVNGSFDSTNPLIVKGVPAAGIREFMCESLMARALDEPFSLYGLIAKTIETPEDRSWVSFTIRSEAKFSDGKPVTVDDVIFSHALLRDKGRPNHRFYYSKVEKVEKLGENEVRFTFKPDGDREMPLIMGLMPILPKHAIDAATFEDTTLNPITCSGPYTIEKVEPGASITYKRNPDYWAKDLAPSVGRFNFDTIRYDYYRDNNAMFEAFKKGLYDFRREESPALWATGYNFPARKDKRVLLTQFPIAIPSGMAALAFNARREIFADIRVRKALIEMFDFEWTNKNLFHGLYARTQSFFERSELSSHSIAADEIEKKLLEPYAEYLDPTILDGSFKLPVHDGSGRIRKSRRTALKLLKEAGYTLKGGKLANTKTGQPFTFEILYVTREQERLFLNFARNLKTIGIDAKLRQVDSAQFQRRKNAYDFDMIQNTWYASLSPGNEQSFRWASKAADTEGTFNYPGIKNPAVDAMIQAVLSAKDRQSFVSAVRALDRLLLSGSYVIPLFHLPKQWTARWSHIEHPEETSLYGFQIDSWWASKAP